MGPDGDGCTCEGVDGWVNVGGYGDVGGSDGFGFHYVVRFSYRIWNLWALMMSIELIILMN
jgi:hypothetical protein